MAADLLNDGGSAFPMQDPQAIHTYALGAVQNLTDTEERDRVYTAARAAAVGGMSLRDYYAGLAMQGLLARRFTKDENDRPFFEWVSECAFEVADTMLKARAR